MKQIDVHVDACLRAADFAKLERNDHLQAFDIQRDEAEAGVWLRYDLVEELLLEQLDWQRLSDRLKTLCDHYRFLLEPCCIEKRLDLIVYHSTYTCTLETPPEFLHRLALLGFPYRIACYPTEF